MNGRRRRIVYNIKMSAEAPKLQPSLRGKVIQYIKQELENQKRGLEVLRNKQDTSQEASAEIFDQEETIKNLEQDLKEVQKYNNQDTIDDYKEKLPK